MPTEEGADEEDEEEDGCPAADIDANEKLALLSY
jgi:hypothetical protein